MTPDERRRLRDGQVERFVDVMRRFVSHEDADKSEDAMVRAVMVRYEHDRRLPLIDVSE